MPDAREFTSSFRLTWARRERPIEAFEAAWDRGQPPALEDFLTDVRGDDRVPVLVELAEIDLERRFQAGLPVDVRNYLERFPELASDPESVFALIRSEYRRRLRREPDLDLEEFLSRFPAYRTWLGERLSPATTRDSGLQTSIDARQPAPVGSGPPRLKGYEVLGELGRGGMGVVYKAIQTDLKRVVAVKMVRAGPHSSPELVARFRTEAEAIARLQHPYIVQVYDLGEHDGLPFFCLEFCAGGSLARKIKGAPLRPAEAAGLVEKLARAMHAAHQRQIVHRDLKPANVLLAEDGTPKVTDFGLAKLLDAEAGPTLSDAIMGTPGYMAPEQVGGGRGQVGPWTDIYALGVILYECLVGRPPFLSPDRYEILTQVVTNEPVSPRRLQPQTPRDLDTICLKCLQKEPARRYATAEELAEDLRRYQAGEPIRARPLGPLGRLGRWCRRQPALAGLLAALALSFFGGFAGVTWQWRRAEANAGEAEKNYHEAQDQQLRAEASLREAETQRGLAQDYFHETLATVDGILMDVSKQLTDVAGSQPARRILLENALHYYQEFRTKHGDDPALQAELAKASFHTGRIYDDLGKYEPAVVAYEEARARHEHLVRSRPGDPKPLSALATSSHFLGLLHRKHRGWSQADQALSHGLEIREKLVADHPEDRAYRLDRAQSLASLGVLHGERAAGDNTLDSAGKKHEREVALGYFEKACALREELAQGQPVTSKYQRDLAQSYGQIGVLKEQMGLLDEALGYYEKSRHIRQLVVQAKPDGLEELSNLAAIYFNSGNVHQQARRLDAALESFEGARSFRARLARYNPTVPRFRYDLALTLNNLGVLYYQLGRFEDALRQYDEALPLLDELIRGDPASRNYPGFQVMTAINRGVVCRELRRPDEAVAQFERVLQTLQGRPNLGRLAETYTHLGRSLHAAGRADEAWCYFEEAFALRQKEFDEKRKDRGAKRQLAECLLHFGVLHREEGRLDAALEAHTKARTLREELLKEGDPDTHFDLGGVCNELGQDLVRLKRNEEALQVFEEARGHERAAFEQAPRMFKYRQGVRQAYANLIDRYKQRGQPDKAATVARELTELEEMGQPESR